jgi:hypothetical protein
MGCAGMSQYMRRYLLLDSGFSAVSFHQFPKALSAHRITGTICEKKRVLRIAYELIPAFIYIS